MKGKVAPTKSTTKAYVSFCFSLSAVVSPDLYRFLYRQWNKRNYSTTISEMFFTFLREKRFSLNVCEAAPQEALQNASAFKRREFWRETHTPLWLLIGQIIFLIREKTSFAILIGCIFFFKCKSRRSRLWLAKTHLRTKIYDIAFSWVFLSMCILK